MNNQLVLKKFLERQTIRELSAVVACLLAFALNAALIQWLPLGLLSLVGMAYFYYRASQCLRLLARPSWMIAYLRINGLAWLIILVLSAGYLFKSGIL